VITNTDIVFVLSGGPSNTDPNASLGGEPSSHQIAAGLDNLFDDVSDSAAVQGVTDYRCFYIFNNSATDNFFNTALWIDSVTDGSGDIFLGLTLANDLQQVVVTGTITGGSLAITYESSTVTWNWSSSLSQWALNLQNALNTITNPPLSGVVVTVSQLGLNTTFQVQFAGNDSFRFQPLLTHGNINTLFGCTGVAITKIVNGSPINSVASTIDVSTTIPFGINFNQPIFSNPITLGALRHTDGFPVWVQRTIPPGSGAVAAAGFVLRYKGSPIS